MLSNNHVSPSHNNSSLINYIFRATIHLYQVLNLLDMTTSVKIKQGIYCQVSPFESVFGPLHMYQDVILIGMASFFAINLLMQFFARTNQLVIDI